MEISEFTFRLLLLFFPGIICAYIVDAFTEHRPREAFFFMIESFAMGISSYFAYWMFCQVLNVVWPRHFHFTVKILRALVDSTLAISFKEVFFASLTAVILGLIITVISTYKLLFRLAQKLRITRKFGELDVWGYAMNMKEVNWVTLRDHKKGLIYDGWVQAFSDDSKNAEILLRDVSVYRNEDAEFLYQIGAVYLSLNREDISIECRTILVSENVRREVKKNVGTKQEDKA